MLNHLKNRILESPLKMITYAEYIEEALYHPTMGYYMKEKEKVGRFGDFITTSNISDIYGRAIASWFAKLVKNTGIPPVVCEIGGGTGRFAKAFIDEWKQISSEEIQYFLLEESPYHRKIQHNNIEFDEQIRQISTLEELKTFKGFIFSNELFDALPVHVIERKNDQIFEVMVALEGETLVEKLIPLANENIFSFLMKNDFSLNNNQRIEIPLSMIEMIKRIGNVLDNGIITTVDYGYTNKEWMEPVHKGGSLRGYYKHQQINNVLKYPGEMDITSHVHFDSLVRVGEENGLSFYKKLRQDQFFLSIGLLEQLTEHEDPNPFSEVGKRNRAIRSLIMPSGMSASFHVIIQYKGIHANLL